MSRIPESPFLNWKSLEPLFFKKTAGTVCIKDLNNTCCCYSFGRKNTRKTVRMRITLYSLLYITFEKNIIFIYLYILPFILFDGVASSKATHLAGAGGSSSSNRRSTERFQRKYLPRRCAISNRRGYTDINN